MLKRLVVVLCVLLPVGGAAAAWAGPAPDAAELLVAAPLLDDLGLTQRTGSEAAPLPDVPTCRHLVAAQEAADPAIVSTAYQRWSTDDEERQFTDSVRVFDTAGAAKAFVRAFRDEDPTEECVEGLLAPQDPSVEHDVRADDREGVRLGTGVVVVPYLVQATFSPESGDIELKAELLVARKGRVVSITFFLAPDEQFGKGGRAVERAVADLLAHV